MSAHAAFRRQPVPGNYAQALKTVTLPAPTRGLVQHENDAYIGPGAAIVSDNWFPTMKGVKLRGGSTRYATLPEAVPVISSFEYVDTSQHRMFAAQATKVYDVTTGVPAAIATRCCAPRTASHGPSCCRRRCPPTAPARSRDPWGLP